MKNGVSLHKTVIINRAVPGSGKTSVTELVVEGLTQAHVACTVHSTDEYFMRDGRYRFNIDNLYSYHLQNLASFRESLRNGTDCVICDNTNIHPWETEPYTTAAREAGYRILILNFPPRPLKHHIKSQIVSDSKPDAHEVPRESLIEFIRDFYAYNTLLDKDFPVDEKTQRHFAWSEKDLDVHDVGPATHFDFDGVMLVHPDTFKKDRAIIPERILAFLRGDPAAANVLGTTAPPPAG